MPELLKKQKRRGSEAETRRGESLRVDSFPINCERLRLSDPPAFSAGDLKRQSWSNSYDCTSTVCRSCEFSHGGIRGGVILGQILRCGVDEEEMWNDCSFCSQREKEVVSAARSRAFQPHTH